MAEKHHRLLPRPTHRRCRSGRTRKRPARRFHVWSGQARYEAAAIATEDSEGESTGIGIRDRFTLAETWVFERRRLGLSDINSQRRAEVGLYGKRIRQPRLPSEPTARKPVGDQRFKSKTSRRTSQCLQADTVTTEIF